MSNPKVCSGHPRFDEHRHHFAVRGRLLRHFTVFFSNFTFPIDLRVASTARHRRRFRKQIHRFVLTFKGSLNSATKPFEVFFCASSSLFAVSAISYCFFCLSFISSSIAAVFVTERFISAESGSCSEAFLVFADPRDGVCSSFFGLDWRPLGGECNHEASRCKSGEA